MRRAATNGLWRALKDAGTLTVGGFKEAADAGQAKVIELHGKRRNRKTLRSPIRMVQRPSFNGFVKKFMFAEMGCGRSACLERLTCVSAAALPTPKQCKRR